MEIFSNETTVHGINHICQRKTKLWQYLWVGLTLISLGFAFRGCFDIVQKYVSNPTSADYQVSSSNSMWLPHLTISTVNLMSLSKLDKYNVSNSLRAIFSSYTNDMPRNILFWNKQPEDFYEAKPTLEMWNETRIEYEQLLATVGAQDFNQLLNHMQLQCTDFIINCSLNGVFFDCCSKSIRKPIFGQQFLFFLDSGYQTGEGFGLQALLSYKPLGNFKDFYPVRAIVTHYFLNPNKMSGTTSQQVDVFPGKINKILLKQTNLNAVKNIPKYNCIEEENYNKLDCLSICFNIDFKPRVTKTCNCTSPLYPTPDIPKFCDPWEMKTCPSNRYNVSDLQSKFEKVCNCPSSCKQDLLTRTVEKSQLDPVTIAEGWNVTVQQAQKHMQDIALIHIQYDSMDKVIIQQKFTMTLSVLLSDIGGQLGFFLGASILSLIHIFMFMMDKIISSFALRHNSCMTKNSTHKQVPRRHSFDATAKPLHWNLQPTPWWVALRHNPHPQ